MFVAFSSENVSPSLCIFFSDRNSGSPSPLSKDAKKRREELANSGKVERGRKEASQEGLSMPQKRRRDTVQENLSQPDLRDYSNNAMHKISDG